MLAEADPRPPQLLLDEAVAVEVIGGLEGKERRYQQDHRPEHLVADVEVVVREAAALMREDAVMRVLARIFRQADAVGRGTGGAARRETMLNASGVRGKRVRFVRSGTGILGDAILVSFGGANSTCRPLRAPPFGMPRPRRRATGRSSCGRCSRKSLSKSSATRPRRESRGFGQARTSSIPTRTGACRDSLTSVSPS